jgi:hypothetical protein
MNASTEKADKQLTGLDLMRAPFEPHQISKLPKESRAQIDERKKTRAAGIWCPECGAWHHKKAIHVDYVGHAALTNRLLDCDPEWNWEPVSTNEDGTPKLDSDGGLWIRLTVCGVTRLGYGDAEGKQGPAAMKERIGDALRNAAMRFGAALELWHKGDLHGVEQDAATEDKGEPDLLSEDQVRQLRDAAKVAGVDEAYVCKAGSVSRLEEIEASRFQAAMNHLQKKAQEVQQ